MTAAGRTAADRSEGQCPGPCRPHFHSSAKGWSARGSKSSGSDGSSSRASKSRPPTSPGAALERPARPVAVVAHVVTDSSGRLQRPRHTWVRAATAA